MIHARRSSLKGLWRALSAFFGGDGRLDHGDEILVQTTLHHLADDAGESSDDGERQQDGSKVDVLVSEFQIMLHPRSPHRLVIHNRLDRVGELE